MSGMKGCHGRGAALVVAALVSASSLAACSRMYYSTMESLGYAKRDLLVSRVEKARDAQEDAKDQFKSALERFDVVVSVDGGKLEEKYDKLNAELVQSEEKAAAVRDRIRAVEDVADALFDEWKDELDQYSSSDLRRASEKKLRDTKARYQQLIGAMHRAEAKIEPVMASFRDQVLFLKHNLNAQALASLQSELVTVESNTAALIEEMDASIAEANEFIRAMERES